jgi:hypothetical protein
MLAIWRKCALKSGSGTSVRVEVDVLPALSVATRSMVSMEAWLLRGAWADGTNDAIVPVPSQGAGGLVEKGN